MPESLAEIFPTRPGHFLLESGHHGDTWLDLDSVWTAPARLAPCAAALAHQLAPHRPEAVCGPQTGGARLAALIAEQLGLPCFAAGKISPAENAPSGQAVLFPARYTLPAADRAAVRDRRVAVIDDVINAGSATRATLAELTAHGAHPVALGALLVYNDRAAELASCHRLPLEFLDRRECRLWAPTTCPLCARCMPLTTPA